MHASPGTAGAAAAAAAAAGGCTSSAQQGAAEASATAGAELGKQVHSPGTGVAAQLEPQVQAGSGLAAACGRPCGSLAAELAASPPRRMPAVLGPLAMMGPDAAAPGKPRRSTAAEQAASPPQRMPASVRPCRSLAAELAASPLRRVPAVASRMAATELAPLRRSALAGKRLRLE